IAVIKEGRIVQVASPRTIYDEPPSQYVANFVGTSNQIAGVLAEKDGDGRGTVDTDFGRIRGLAVNAEVGDAVVAVIRPERCGLSSRQPTDSTNVWSTTVDTSMFLGSHVEIVVRVGEHSVRVWRPDADTL